MTWRTVPFRRGLPWWRWRFEVIRQDCWIGARWARTPAHRRTDVWVCLVPMVPFHLRIDDPPF